MKLKSSSQDTATQLKMAEEALLRSEKLAMASRYAGAIMHEINNPLEALTNLIFLTKMISPDKKVQENMEIAEAQIKRLGEITRKSLDFYKDEQEAQEFDLIDIAESALTIHTKRLRNQRVELQKRLWPPAMAKVLAGEMLQVLSNLILNALDAMPTDGATLSVRVRSCPVRVHITISDNGKGMEPAVLRCLFEANRTTKAHGTGFGLWLSRRIVEKHGGTIHCRTSQQPGHRGTTFRVCVPIIGSSPKAA